MGAFRNLRIEPFDILGKMRHAKMVSTRTHLVPQTSSASQQLVGIAHDFELLVNIFEPAYPIQMILFATSTNNGRGATSDAMSPMSSRRQSPGV